MKRGISWSSALLMVVLTQAAEPSPKDSAVPPENPAAQPPQAAFDALAPSKVKEHAEFPAQARWDGFVNRLQVALAGDNPADLALFEREVRMTLATLRQVPDSEEYRDWLQERLDYIEAAREMTEQSGPKPTTGPSGQFIPHYDLWLRRLQARVLPAVAEDYVCLLLPVFAAAGVPGELVWLAEVESSFNPTALSPVGACGLYQLMPATARELGLQTDSADERTDPLKSAEAAARMLRKLHAKFGDWPLALAAYNAGSGRVQRTLDQQQAKTFAQIASALPLETRMFVPKVLAVLKVRTGISLAGPARP